MDSVKFFKKTFLFLIIFISSISVYSQNKFFNNDKTKLGFDFGVGSQRINNNSLKLDLLNVKYTYNLYLFQFQYYYSLYDKEKLSIESLIQPQYNFAKYTLHDDSEEILTAHEAGINIGFLIRKKFRKDFSLYFLISSGPHYVSGVPHRQSSGFIFSDNFNFGINIKASENIYLDIRPGFRHISNAGIQNPNGGVNNLILNVGVVSSF